MGVSWFIPDVGTELAANDDLTFGPPGKVRLNKRRCILYSAVTGKVQDFFQDAAY